MTTSTTLLTVDKVAARLGWTVSEVRGAITHKGLPITRFTPRGRIFIQETQLAAWIEAHTRAVAPSPATRRPGLAPAVSRDAADISDLITERVF